jgi:hypothetical protein
MQLFRTAAIVLGLATLTVSASADLDAPRKHVVLDRLEADRARIQRHLQRVEAELRAVDVSHLSEAQASARSAALDRLHEYWVAGVFPHNDYVAGRTPVFIDEGGRACAVGDLLIHTGAADAAETIAAEENLARVPDIASVDLGPWLLAHGFTLAEAKAIQPTYCFTCDDMADDPVCGADGNVYRNACVANECMGVAVAAVCTSDPCECAAGDAGTPRLDAGPGDPPDTDDGGCAVGGSGSAGAFALACLVLFARRRR